jgi:group I intron endonuclease
MLIYKATNIINNKCYIGQTIQAFNIRKMNHKAQSKRSNGYFQRAINKYGWDNFIWEVVCECESRDNLNEMEKYYINFYDSFNNGYNLTTGGDSYIMSDETKQNISKNYAMSSKLPEVRYKISKTLMGHEVRLDSRKRISKSLHTKERKEGYIIYHPNGDIEITECIYTFCGRYQLNTTLMDRVAKGTQSHHKGFICDYINNKLRFEKQPPKSNKLWVIVDGTGKSTYHFDISSFCKKNNLRSSHMTEVSQGKRAHHKGFICKRLR